MVTIAHLELELIITGTVALEVERVDDIEREYFEPVDGKTEGCRVTIATAESVDPG